MVPKGAAHPRGLGTRFSRIFSFSLLKFHFALSGCLPVEFRWCFRVFFFGWDSKFCNNWLLTLSEVKGCVMNCSIVIDIFEGQKRQRWGVNGRLPKSKKQHKKQQQKEQQETRREQGWGPEGWGPKISFFFSLLRLKFHSFVLSLGVFSWNFSV